MFITIVTFGHFLSAQTQLIYDGTDTSLLHTDPFNWSTQTLFPGASLTDNTVTVIGGNIDGNVFGAALKGNGAISNNIVNISPDTSFDAVQINRHVYGGIVSLSTEDTTVGSNRVNVAGGKIGFSIAGGYIFASSATAIGTGNSVYASGNTKAVAIYGSHIHSATTANVIANTNTVTISDSVAVEVNVNGGLAYNSDTGFATANDNTVTISDNADIQGWVQAGSAQSVSGDATANNNSAIISGNAHVNSVVYGGEAGSSYNNAFANSNSVTASGGEISSEIRGGYAYSSVGDATANSNTISSTSSARVNGNISGGYAFVNVYSYSYMGFASAVSGDANANHNTVSISSNTGMDVYDGHATITAIARAENLVNARASAGDATANNNTIIISEDAVVEGSVYGGYTSSSASASADSGSATEESGIASASYNIVTVTHGTIKGDVYGGYASSRIGTANATDNTINLHAKADLSAAHIYGGYTDGGIEDARSRNALNVFGTGLTIKGISNFQNYTFHVDADMAKAEANLPMLTVTDIELTFMTGDTGTIDLGQLIGDISQHESLDILYAVAGLTAGSENIIWTVINYSGEVVADDELIAFWQNDILKVGWSSAIPEPSITSVLAAMITFAITQASRRRTKS